MATITRCDFCGTETSGTVYHVTITRRGSQLGPDVTFDACPSCTGNIKRPPMAAEPSKRP